MRKAISLLIATSLVVTTLWLSSSPGSAQQSPKPPKPDDPVLKALQKNWDQLPPQAKRAADPKAKEQWEKLTPRQHEVLRAKILEIITTQTEIYKKDKAAIKAALKTWDDVINREGPNSGEDETLTFVDDAGKPRSVKARRRDGSMKPNPAKVGGSGRLRTQPKPVWETDWAVANLSTDKSKSKSHHGTRRSTKAATLSPAQAGCTRGTEQFVRTFYGGLFNFTNYEGALARPPSASELSSWMNTLAQAQSQGTTLDAARNLGFTLFGSAEYAGRGRSNRDFVYDCYVAFLKRLPEPAGWDFWTAHADAHGQAAVVPGFAYSTEFSDVVNSLCNVSSFDGDQDGLPDNFENNLADAFTPQYHTSYDEPDEYATMQDFVPMTVKRTFGTNPVSNFRVTPVTITTNPHTGQLQSYLRIDYLTLWDHDSGLVGGWSCGLAGLFLSGILSHPKDAERSALLVAAPSNGTYNTDPNAYQSVSLYTAAHENTFVDHSEYHDFPTSPMPAGFHVPLWSSLQKHSTYTFDPDWMPILEIYLQIMIWHYVDYYFSYGCEGWWPGDPFWYEYGFEQMCTDQYYYVYWEVFFIIYTCAVERFHSGNTDGLVSLAPTRINVGETANPINGSTFIQDNSSTGFHLRDKLDTPLWFSIP